MFRLIALAYIGAVAASADVLNNNNLAKKVTYDDHMVLRCIPTDATKISELQKLDLDFWMEPRKVGVPIDVLVTEQTRTSIEDQLSKHGIIPSNCRMMIKNLQSLIDDEAKKLVLKDLPFFENYHTWKEVYDYVDSLVSIHSIYI
jgi:hypothetical protein